MSRSAGHNFRNAFVFVKFWEILCDALAILDTTEIEETSGTTVFPLSQYTRAIKKQ